MFSVYKTIFMVLITMEGEVCLYFFDTDRESLIQTSLSGKGIFFLAHIFEMSRVGLFSHGWIHGWDDIKWTWLFFIPQICVWVFFLGSLWWPPGTVTLMVARWLQALVSYFSKFQSNGIGQNRPFLFKKKISGSYTSL